MLEMRHNSATNDCYTSETASWLIFRYFLHMVSQIKQYGVKVESIDASTVRHMRVK